CFDPRELEPSPARQPTLCGGKWNGGWPSTARSPREHRSIWTTRSLVKDGIQQQLLDIGGRNVVLLEQSPPIRDHQRTIFGLVGQPTVRAADERCIERDHVHESAKSQLAQKETLADGSLRRRYGGIEEKFDRIIAWLAVNLDGAREVGCPAII